MMIIKKEILGKQIIQRKRKSQIRNEDRYLFERDFKSKIKNCYIYNLKNTKVLSNGIFETKSKEIIKDYLSFNSLSKIIFFKKIILLLKFKINIWKNFNKKIIFLKNKKYIILYNRNSNGYFHWITDTLIKLDYLSKSEFKSHILIFPFYLKKKKIIESLKFFKLRYIFLKKNNSYQIDNLSYLSEFHISGSPRPKILLNFIKKFKIKKNYSDRRIYISRNKSNRRQIINELELLKMLKKYNFKKVYLENLTIKQQIKLFSSSKIVVGLHGAGLTNIIWMNQNSKIIELRPEKDMFLNCYYNISDIIKLKYFYSICKKINFVKSSKNANYLVDIFDLEKKIQSAI